MKQLAALLAFCVVPLLTADPAKVAGVWNVTLELEAITGHPVLTLKQDGGKVTGTYEGHYGVSALEGTVKDKTIEFAVTIIAEGTETTGTFTGTVDGDTMSGAVSFQGTGEGTWTATRAPSKK